MKYLTHTILTLLLAVGIQTVFAGSLTQQKSRFAETEVLEAEETYTIYIGLDAEEDALPKRVAHQKDILLVPSPEHYHFHIQFTGLFYDKIEARVFSPSGQTLTRMQKRNVTSGSAYKFHYGSLPEATYTLWIKTGINRVVKQKIRLENTLFHGAA